MAAINPLDKIENEPWWVREFMRRESVIGVLLTTGHMMIIAYVIGLRSVAKTTWVDFSWDHTPDTAREMKKNQMKTVDTWEWTDQKRRFNFITKPSPLTQHGSIRLDHIVAVMEMIDAQ